MEPVGFILDLLRKIMEYNFVVKIVRFITNAISNKIRAGGVHIYLTIDNGFANMFSHFGRGSHENTRSTL